MSFFVGPCFARLAGYRKQKLGKCAVWAPKAVMQGIIDGINLLAELDQGAFTEITAGRRMVVFYHRDRFFHQWRQMSVTENFLAWGKPGVALCVVSSLYVFRYQRQVGTRQPLPQTWPLQKTIEWASARALPEELKEQYTAMSPALGDGPN